MDLKDFSVTVLAGLLDLPKKRIEQLLKDEKIYIDQFGEICIKAY